MTSSRLTLCVALCVCTLAALFSPGGARSTAHVHGNRMNVTDIEIGVDFITVSWVVRDEIEADAFHVRARKLDTSVTIVSNPIWKNLTEFTVGDLVHTSKYEVCVHLQGWDISDSTASNCTGTESDADPRDCFECIQLETIPIMRLDSIIGLIVCVLFILFLVMCGYCCWNCERNKRKTVEEEEGSIDPDTKPMLLNVPSTNGPRRSVEFEDEDIPYITPPVENSPQAAEAEKKPGTYV